MEAGGGEVLGQWAHAGERPEEQPRVLVRGSREFTASVRSSGRCQGDRKGTGEVDYGGTMTASTAAQWPRRGGGGSVAPRGGRGRVAPFIAGRSGWQRQRYLRPGRWWR
jgi:hypothetical protein